MKIVVFFFDWYNAFFEIQFKMDLKANGGDNADTLSTVINGSHSFIKRLAIKSRGIIVYDTDNLHLVTFIKNLLEYSDDYSRSVAKNSFWYLDTAATAVDADNTGFASRRALTSDGKQVNVKIPINRYSFFEELEGRILPPMQLAFEIEFNPDAELLFGGVDTTRVTIDRFYLCVPKIIPKDNLISKYISDFQKPSKWKYLREKSNIRKQSGSGIFSAVLPALRAVAPTVAKTLGISALAGAASEGATQIIKKISGGQLFQIPNDKLFMLAQLSDLLTPKQKRDLATAHQLMQDMNFRVTQKQVGNGIGSILASIGIPLVIDAVKGLTGGSAVRIGNRGGAALRIGRSPPFIGSWEGRGKKKKGQKGQGLLLGKNRPFKNIPLVGKKA